MDFSVKISQAYELLRNYNGENGYIINLKNDVYVYHKTLNDFYIEFILQNKDFTPIYIGKNVRFAEWFGKWAEKKYELGFTPKLMEIGYFMGQTSSSYVFYGRFRKSQEKGYLIVCDKEAIYTDFLTPDFRTLQVDFSKYNAMAKDGTVLRPHQEDAVKFLLARKKCILADEPGSGKSKCCAVASIAGGFKKILIICPASVKPTWKRELSAYVPEDQISIIEGFNGMKKGELEKFLGYEEGKSGLKKEELLERAKKAGKWNENKYTIVNYDILQDFYEIPTEERTVTERDVDENGNIVTTKKKKTVTSRKKDVISEAMSNSEMFQSQFDLIIIDEAHRLSNLTSGRFKIMADFVKRTSAQSIYCVTGTPITNNPYNFFQILKIINAPIVKEWESYVKRYCDGKKIYLKGQRDKWTSVYLKSKGVSSWYNLTDKQKDDLKVFLDKNCRSVWLHSGATNLDELKERVKGYYLRREQKDFGKIVQKTVKLLEYELTDSQRVEYEKEYEAFIEKQVANQSTTTLMIEGVAMRQWLAREMIPYTKKLTDYHLSKGEKVIIFCSFDNELYALKEIYKDCCATFNGKMTPKEKIKAEKDFMEDPDCKVMVANIESCGVGLTLTSSNVCIFNNFSWQSGNNEQAEDRIYRLSQTKDVVIYYQLFKDTFFEKMFNKVKEKENIISQIIVNEKNK